MSVIDYSWDFTKEEFNLDLDFFNEKDQEDKLWQARTGFDSETLCGAIETIIFMSDRPINLQKIKTQIDPDLPLRVVHDSIARLQSEYEARHHGIRLMEVASGYQFRTKATYAKVLQSMFKVSSLQLSPTALEVLAIIAYKQPISKTAVESIRGVDSSHIVRALMDKRLVKITGRSEEMGRPSLFGTTSEFLEIFNLNELTDLPSEIELDEIASNNEVGEISEIKSIVQSGDKKMFDFDELAELDLLSESIKDIASDTFFTRTLKDLDKKRVTEEGVEKKSAFDILEEHVNMAQVVEQNRSSMESSTLTTMMEPRSVSLSQLKEFLNAPKLDEDEFDIEVELEDDSFPEISSSFEELDSSSMREIEAKADDILEKSHELINQLSNDQTLDDELDLAFDNLLAGNEEDQIDNSQIEEASSPVNTDELDIASFIASKIQNAAPVSTQDSEEKDLADALDDAFDKLMGSSEAPDFTDTALEDSAQINEKAALAAKELDIDLDFLNPDTTES